MNSPRGREEYGRISDSPSVAGEVAHPTRLRRMGICLKRGLRPRNDRPSSRPWDDSRHDARGARPGWAWGREDGGGGVGHSRGATRTWVAAGGAGVRSRRLRRQHIPIRRSRVGSAGLPPAPRVGDPRLIPTGPRTDGPGGRWDTDATASHGAQPGGRGARSRRLRCQRIPIRRSRVGSAGLPALGSAGRRPAFDTDATSH